MARRRLDTVIYDPLDVPRVVVARARWIAAYLRRVDASLPRRFVRQVQVSSACVRDVLSGKYEVPWTTVIALAGALLYFLDPFDAIPDAIPFAGFVDDAGVLALVISTVESDLRSYCTWRGIDPATCV